MSNDLNWKKLFLFGNRNGKASSLSSSLSLSSKLNASSSNDSYKSNSSSSSNSSKPSMFFNLTNRFFGKYKPAKNSKVVTVGVLSINVNNSSIIKEGHCLLRKTETSRFYLEVYDHSSYKLKHLILIVDFEHVLQIDFKKSKNAIYLLNENESCVLSSNDARATKQWLRLICNNCGFNEIYDITNTTLPASDTSVENSVVNEPPAYANSSVSSMASVQRKKSVAGSAARLVGSINLNDSLFKSAQMMPISDSNNNQVLLNKNVNAQVNTSNRNLKKLNQTTTLTTTATNIRHSYLNLDQCISGDTINEEVADDEQPINLPNSLEYVNENMIYGNRFLPSTDSGLTQHIQMTKKSSGSIDSTYDNEFDSFSDTTANDRYVNLIKMEEEKLQPIPKTNYVQIEIVNTSKSMPLEQQWHFDRSLSLSASSQMTSSGHSSQIDGVSKTMTKPIKAYGTCHEDAERAYTNCDLIRTRALKNAKDNFHRIKS